jgi:Cu/Ag efflux protein CusF
MNVEREIRALAVEMLATKTVISHVLGRINQLDPVLAAAIQGGFRDATDEIKNIAAKSGKKTSSDRALKSLAIVEALRSAILANWQESNASTGRQRR